MANIRMPYSVRWSLIIGMVRTGSVRNFGPRALELAPAGMGVSAPACQKRFDLVPPLLVYGFGIRFRLHAPGKLLDLPRQVWLRLEELDEGTFLYWEEHILAERARRLGIEMRFEPRLRIYHKWSRTAQDNHWDAFVRSGMYYLRRYRGAGSLQIAGWRFLWSLQGIWRLLRRIGSSPLKSS